MADVLPDFAPLMLSGLTYPEAVRQMHETGCALRRPHWCAPVLVFDHDRIWLDDEEELLTWEPQPSDERASDWMMVAQPNTERKGGE